MFWLLLEWRQKYYNIFAKREDHAFYVKDIFKRVTEIFCDPLCFIGIFHFRKAYDGIVSEAEGFGVRVSDFRCKEVINVKNGARLGFVDDVELTPMASAYIRARGSDRMSSYGDFAALSDECDAACAKYLSKEVSDGVIAPSFSKEALAILKKKKKGKYVVIQMDPSYVPEVIEQKDVFGITFEQGRNNIKISDALFTEIPTQNKTLSAEQKRDLLVALITLKYTQSNSVCYVKNGQAAGIGAGQQSRVHCTRLAGNKADNWYLRQHEKVLTLPFKDGIRRADRDNAIDVYISDDYEDLLNDGMWQEMFMAKPEPFTKEEKKAWLATLQNVALGSDAFFPFGDNIERAHKSGVSCIAQAGGSIRDDHVIMTCDKYNIAMCMTHVRLFHH